ncbi:MAG: ribonuclease E/G, partial [Chitinophagales bacterium]|nr:ribonuclease E/G [Hyphomicrobiales bacterium]
MGNKMLIDAAHPEETRVVVVRGNRVEEFDFESQSRKQLRGSIFLAKVIRVEPSLQAAFVDYGGNRHGFLAFAEIHPDYYRLPQAEMQEARASHARDTRYSEKPDRPEHSQDTPVDDGQIAPPPAEPENTDGASQSPETLAGSEAAPAVDDGLDNTPPRSIALDARVDEVKSETIEADASSEHAAETNASDDGPALSVEYKSHANDDEDAEDDDELSVKEDSEQGVVESVGGEDALEELPQRDRSRRRSYKIQEVIKRNQIILVQVVKEERGTKGAALTTFLSLAGRYTVLMPNTASGGGISRKISIATDRKRLREIATELDVPQGMGLIIRTAGAARTKAEIKRDFEYLLRLWENVRDLTLKSKAPTLVYEEGDLIKRSIRDLYNREIDEILVAGDDAYREAKDFMRMLMPSHAKNVQPYKDPEPIFTRHGVENQLNMMFNPRVTLKSGGYIVINQTEALVAVDVNSGKSTREHSIEDTALKTNVEAADEVARQLRLRDLAGLIVIDFIDMEERRN